MFIDAVRAFRGQVDDPELRRDVKAFTGQEAVHARVHEAVWDELREHGVPIDSYAGLIERFRAAVEPHVSPELLLATTAPLEHYTAAFGKAFLTEELDDVLPRGMAELLAWHGAEELEHRSVAFDVLERVDDGRGLRIAGMAMATALLTAVPAVGVGMFALADGIRRPWSVLRPRVPDPVLVRMTARFLVGMVDEVRRYVEPGFHPADEPFPDAYHRWLAAAVA